MNQSNTKITVLPDNSYDGIVKTITSWSGEVTTLPAVSAAVNALADVYGEGIEDTADLTPAQRRRMITLFLEKFRDIGDPEVVPVPDNDDVVHSGDTDCDDFFNDLPSTNVDALSMAIVRTGYLKTVYMNNCTDPDDLLRQLLARPRRMKPTWKFSGVGGGVSTMLTADQVRSEYERTMFAGESLRITVCLPVSWVIHQLHQLPGGVLGSQQWMTASALHGISICVDGFSVIKERHGEIILDEVLVRVNMPEPSRPWGFTVIANEMNGTWFTTSLTINGKTGEITTTELKRKK